MIVSTFNGAVSFSLYSNWISRLWLTCYHICSWFSYRLNLSDTYDESAKCNQLSQCILENRISIFPQHQLCLGKNQYIICAKYIDSTKKMDTCYTKLMLSYFTNRWTFNWFWYYKHFSTFRLSQTCTKNSGETSCHFSA